MDITIIYGKEQQILTIPLEEGPNVHVTKLKAWIEPLFNTPANGQKLLYRGKELKDGTTLDINTLGTKPKMMLLCRAPAASPAPKPMENTLQKTMESSTPAASPAPAAPSVQVGENQFLVEVVHGKLKHRVAMDKDRSVIDVKKYVEGQCNVPVANQKLLHKGKYPANDTLLSTLSSKSSIVFMLLLHEAQHIHNEVKLSTKEMQQHLSDYQAIFTRLQAQMARNFYDSSDFQLQLRQLIDAVEILQSNTDIAHDTAASDDLRALSTCIKALYEEILKLQEEFITRRA